MHKFVTVAIVAAVAAAVPGTAQTADDFAAKVINNPLPGNLTVFGLPSPPPVVRVKEAEGGKVLRVKIPGADPEPWKISLSSTATQPVRKGDRVVLAFYARTFGMAAGEKARIANASIQLASAPYTGVFGNPIEVGDQFEFHQVAGKADRDYAAGELGASLQLATGKQTIDFGPLFILNLDKK